MQALTYKELVDEALVKAGFGSSTTGNMRTLFQQTLRAAHERRVVSQDYPFMRMPAPSTFTLVAGQQAYSLSPLFRAPIYFRLRESNQPLIEAKSDMLLETGLPKTGTQDDPYRFELRGDSQMLQQPLTTSTVQATSSSSADNAKTVTVTGVDASGYFLEETLTLATVVVPSTGSFSRIDAIRKNGTGWSGTLTVTANDASSTTVARFESGSYGTFARQFYLLTAPSASEVVEYDFFRLPNRLVEDTDVPNIPPPHSRILIYDTLLETSGVTRPTPDEKARWEEVLIEMQHNLDSAYLEGQSNMADASYVHLIPR
jgi:hypothetical protein